MSRLEVVQPVVDQLLLVGSQGPPESPAVAPRVSTSMPPTPWNTVRYYRVLPWTLIVWQMRSPWANLQLMVRLRFFEIIPPDVEKRKYYIRGDYPLSIFVDQFMFWVRLFFFPKVWDTKPFQLMVHSYGLVFPGTPPVAQPVRLWYHHL